MRRFLIVLAGLTLIAAAAFASIATEFTYSAPLDSFRREPGDKRIVVLARLGFGDSVIWHFAREDDKAVRVLVWTRREPGPKPLIAFRETIQIVLSAPLGERSVRDWDDKVVAEQR